MGADQAHVAWSHVNYPNLVAYVPYQGPKNFLSDQNQFKFPLITSQPTANLHPKAWEPKKPGPRRGKGAAMNVENA